jgi:protein gp37
VRLHYFGNYLFGRPNFLDGLLLEERRVKNSAIQWTDHTFNAWEGCTKVAPECKNCYAETLVDHRFSRAKWGKGQPRHRTSAAYWKQPLQWNREAERAPCRPRVFCLSLGDWLDEEVPIEWLADLLKLIHDTPNLDWLLLNKRPQNFTERLTATLYADKYGQQVAWLDGRHPENVWIGVSAGADQAASLEIPAKIHFLSCEPMLKPLDHYYLPTQEFDWIIFGGESGKNARLCDVDWIRDGIAFCKRLQIACFVKQLGANIVDNTVITPPGKLQDSHGGDWDEWPDELRVREFP